MKISEGHAKESLFNRDSIEVRLSQFSYKKLDLKDGESVTSTYRDLLYSREDKSLKQDLEHLSILMNQPVKYNMFSWYLDPGTSYEN